MNPTQYTEHTQIKVQHSPEIKITTVTITQPLVRPLVLLTLLVAIGFSGTASAGSCGVGKVLEVKEGGWNTNDLMVKIDYAGGTGTSNNYQGYIRFRENLDAMRLKGIRAVAYLAMATGKSVTTFTHNSGTDACTKATEITIKK